LKKETIIQLLPYQAPFLFVEELTYISENRSEGYYTFKNDEYFYQGHFKDKPITPGVILTEVMAQIGVVCLGIYLLKNDFSEIKKPQIALTSNEVDFFLPVKPKERVKVVSEKIYFRFNKLKCKVHLFNEKKELVCNGTISGMLKVMNNET
jgi:3-hydroxyacyl-[acyl-carrier-protein] dehydratase